LARHHGLILFFDRREQLTQTSGPVGIFTQNYPIEDAVFEALTLPSDDIVDGSPVIENATLHQSEDGRLLVGVARLSGGTIRYLQTADEIDYVTRGRLIVTSDRDERPIICTTGSVNRLTKGVVYTKEVIEPYEEVYVMFSDEGFEL
jgi:uncharacterized cupin superfamily protein